MALVVLLGACGRGAPPAAAVPSAEERLLETILVEQRKRVDAAALNVQKAHDWAASVRLRRRALELHGRPDLAMQLESAALNFEGEERMFRVALADEEDALRAYHAYAARVS